MKRWLKFWWQMCTLLLGLVLPQAPTLADVFTNTTSQGFQNSLTAAGSIAGSNTLFLAPGHYSGTFVYSSSISNDLTIASLPSSASNSVVLDGDAAGNALFVSNSVSGALTIRDITFQRNCLDNTQSALAVGISTNSPITLVGCNFISPPNSYGAGVSISSAGDFFMRRCEVIGPSIGRGSCGLSIRGIVGIAWVEESIIKANNAGGLSISEGRSLVVIKNNISGNSADFWGGIQSQVTTSCTNNILNDNRALPPQADMLANGAGINCNSSIVLELNQMTGNSVSTGAGGALFCQSGILISNSFTGNFSALGGGVWCADCVMLGNTFDGNSSVEGGGAYIVGNALIKDNIFRNNWVSSAAVNPSWSGYSHFGGGIFCSGNTLLCSNVFFGNQATNFFLFDFANVYAPIYPGEGGAAYVFAGSIVENKFLGNSAGTEGGALVILRGVTNVIGNLFVSNSVTGDHTYESYIGALVGGGAMSIYGDAVVSRNEFVGNSITNGGHGGGVVWIANNIKLRNNLFIRNSAISGDGGAAWLNGTTTSLFINNTVTQNSAGGSGGGVAIAVPDGGIVNVWNSILYGNSHSASGADLFLAGGLPQRTICSHNFIGKSAGQSWAVFESNTNLDPLFFDPVNGDYHLMTNSPCRNAGSAAVTNLVTFALFDLDGTPIPRSDGTVDIGCYQINTTTPHPADTNGDFVISQAEFDAYFAAWQQGVPFNNAGVVPTADLVTRAGYILKHGGAYFNAGSNRPKNWTPVSP